MMSVATASLNADVCYLRRQATCNAHSQECTIVRPGGGVVQLYWLDDEICSAHNQEGSLPSLKVILQPCEGVEVNWNMRKTRRYLSSNVGTTHCD